MEQNSRFSRTLATGVSVVALCVTMPVWAQEQQTTVTVPGVVLPDDFTFPAGETFSSGVTASGERASTAEVASTETGTIRQGEESEEHTATANGNYTVVVGNANGCENTTSAFNVTGIGVNELGANWALQCYPNPTNGTFTLAVSSVSAADWWLYNSLGQLVQNGNLQGATLINIASHAEGIYYLRVKVDGDVVTKKVLLAK